MTSFDAALCTALNGPESLRVQKMSRLPLRPGEVRLKVLASGINFPDLLMTRGAYQFRPEPPFTPGLEVAGEVTEVGPESDATCGDRVCATLTLGGYAREVTVSATALKTWPPGYSAAQAAGFYVAAATAWHALVDRAAAKRGERLLVLGAGGGVGLAAVQLGRALGLEVIAAARNPERLEAAGRAGAGSLIAPETPLRTAVEERFGKRSIDIVFDPVGGSLAAEAASCLAWNGRYLIVGFASGVIPSLAFNKMLLGGYAVLGVRAGESAKRDPDGAKRGLAALLRLAAASDLKPIIGLEMPLSRASDALQALDRGDVVGKAILVAD